MEFSKIKKILRKFEKIYPETINQEIIKNNKNRDNEEKIKEYAIIIYDFVFENIKLQMIVEGQHLYKWMDFSY